jgi:hypothetical protein
MASKADAFRRYANEYRQLAESATNSIDKEHWLQMAAHCMRMAAAADSAAGKGGVALFRKGRWLQMMPYQLAMDLMAATSICS